MRVLAIILLVLALMHPLGCATRSLTKSRSEIIEDAHSSGIAIPGIEEDRRRFHAVEESNRQRLLSLISERARTTNLNAHYKLGAGDQVEINVFDVPELTTMVRVRDSGFVTLPLLGAVRAGGLTEAQFQENLTGRLLTFVKAPQVSVFVSEFGSQKVAVLGAVQEPGTYSLSKGKNSVLELISEAGGLSDSAGNYIKFIPAEATGIAAAHPSEARAQLAFASYSQSKFEQSGVEVYLDHVMGTGGGIPIEIPVRGGDMIIVPEAGRVMVEGEVEKRGAYELGRRMSLLGALAAAGGITFGADVEEVEVVREISPSEKVRLVVSLESILTAQEKDIPLRNGDLIRVPSDPSRRMRQDTYEAITRIINFGVGGTVNVAN